MGPAAVLTSAVTLNQPGRYLHWSIFTVSVANLVLIAVMVVIFGLALASAVPQGPRRGIRAGGEAAAAGPERPPDGDDVAERTGRMWTGRLRRWGLRTLPPDKLLPDRQPAYVASWIYVFGVASLATLALAIVSGFLIAIGGPDWWHTNPVGHFFNSMHLWSVELFMAFWSSTCGGSSGWRPGGGGAGHVDHGGGGVHGLDRRVLHRLPLPAELRLAVDLDQRQGRLQRGRGGRLLQPHELRPDAPVARGAHPHRAGGHRRAPTFCWCGCGGCAPAPVHRARGRAARRAAADGRRRRVARPDPPLRHREGGRGRRLVGLVLVAAAGRHPLLARRPGGDDLGVGPPGTGRLHGHRRLRAGRHKRDGHLRPPLQPPDRHRAAACCSHPRVGRGAPARHSGQDIRARPARPRSPRPTRRWPRALAAYQAATPAQRQKWDQAYLQGGHAGHVHPRGHADRARRRPTGRSRP